MPVIDSITIDNVNYSIQDSTSRGQIEDIQANFAGPFVESAANDEGTYVTYTDGKLYYLPSGHTANVTWANTTKTAVTVGAELSDLKSAFEQHIVYPEGTAFAGRISASAQWMTYYDAHMGITKLESVVPYNGNLITSNGSDSWIFRNPYYGFQFGIKTPSYNTLCLLKCPKGTPGEALSILETLTGTTSGNFTTYTVNQPAGTVVLFAKAKSYPERILTAIQNPINEPNLELNNVQDTFARYSVRGAATNVTPSVTKQVGYLVNTTYGTLGENASYDTYYFRCPVSGGLTVTCTNAIRCVITTLDPTLIDETGYLVSVIYSNESDRVDTFNLAYGQYAIFSLSHAQQPNINLVTDYIKTFTLPTLRLAYGQKNGFYKISTVSSQTYVDIYYVSGNKVVMWELKNTPSSTINSNTWQLGHVVGYDFDGRVVSNAVELVAAGEFELAFKEYGAADYCGGVNHGDENQTDFVLIIDGKAINTASADGAFHSFERIEAVEHALINRCDTPNDNILKHQKIWIFENGAVKVLQTLEFLQSMECDFLCCMLPANKTAFNKGVRQKGVVTETLTADTFDSVITSGNEMAYLMYGANASAKVTARTCAHTPDAVLWINNAPTLNKLYYNFYGQMPRTNVPSGTVVWWEQEYDIAYE